GPITITITITISGRNPMQTNCPGAPERTSDPCVMVVFGGRGDLARRKLVPSLYNLARNGFLNPRFALIGMARTPMTDDEFRAMMTEAVQEFGGPIDPKIW